MYQIIPYLSIMTIVVSSLMRMSGEFVYYQNAQYLHKHNYSHRDNLSIISLRGCNSIVESIMHLYS
jgi:hypothetical protein